MPWQTHPDVAWGHAKTVAGWAFLSLTPLMDGCLPDCEFAIVHPFASQICLFKTVPYQTNALVCSPATCISSLFPGLVMVAMVATLPRRIPGVDRKTDLKMGSFTRACSSVRVKTPSADKVIPLNIWENMSGMKVGTMDQLRVILIDLDCLNCSSQV